MPFSNWVRLMRENINLPSSEGTFLIPTPRQTTYLSVDQGLASSVTNLNRLRIAKSNRIPHRCNSPGDAVELPSGLSMVRGSRLALGHAALRLAFGAITFRLAPLFVDMLPRPSQRGRAPQCGVCVRSHRGRWHLCRPQRVVGEHFGQHHIVGVDGIGEHVVHMCDRRLGAGAVQCPPFVRVGRQVQQGGRPKGTAATGPSAAGRVISRSVSWVRRRISSRAHLTIDHRTAASRRSSASMMSRSRMSLTRRPLIDRNRPRNAAQIW